MALRRRVLVALFCLALAGLSVPASPSVQRCTVREQNTFVRTTLRDIYYWYREMPNLSPARYPSPEAYLEAVRYRPLDTSFSYISSAQEEEAFYSDSQYVGVGLSTKFLAIDDLRISEVYPDSPASEAGLRRGDRILAIGGRSVADLVARGDLGTAFGPGEVGFTVEVDYADLTGMVGRVTLVKRLVTIPTVSATRTYSVGARTVGYVFFRNFVEPSFAALDIAFADLRAAGASDLVLDLRYNGGGLVAVAQHLASLIGGLRTHGQPFALFAHNDKNTFRDRTLPFEDVGPSLDAARLVVVTTRSSASASELVINGLRPFLPVALVGDRTFGKPVGQYGYGFCDKVLHPVAFALRNALGEGDYYDGIPADCAAADDLDRELGDPAETSLAEALHYLETGACSALSGEASAAARRQPPRLQESGWQQLVGAY